VGWLVKVCELYVNALILTSLPGLRPMVFCTALGGVAYIGDEQIMNKTISIIRTSRVGVYLVPPGRALLSTGV
jgi:hypothetical protein